MSKIESIIEDFTKALDRFAEVLQEKKTDIVRDSAIKRFELAFDIVWKTLKIYLEEHHNAVCNSPKNCVREAFNKGVIANNDFWLDIVSDRNYTAHIYKEALAEYIYAKLPEALKHFQQLLTNIKEQIKKVEK